MTKDEKLTMLESICGDSDATPEMLETYLNLAEDVVIHRAFPFLTNYVLAAVPPQYDTLQVQIANEMYLKRGAEGEKDHSENGVKRTYETGSVSTSLLKQIVPYTRILGEKIPSDGEISAAIIPIIPVGGTSQITPITIVTCTDDSVVEVDEGYKYVSSDTGILTVSAKGLVTAKIPGTAFITVTGKKSGFSVVLETEVV